MSGSLDAKCIPASLWMWFPGSLWQQVLVLHANVTVTHGLTYHTAGHVDRMADEVGGGCYYRLNSARSHTDLGKDRPQNGVDPASAI